MDHDCPRAIVASARGYDAALETPPHTYPRGQLIYAEHGTLTTTAATGTWVAPPNRAIWIPADVTHVTRLTVNTEIRSIYIRKDAIPGLPVHCAVVEVNPLLRELILAVVRLPALYEKMARTVALSRCCWTVSQLSRWSRCTCRHQRARSCAPSRQILRSVLTCRLQKQRAMPR